MLESFLLEILSSIIQSLLKKFSLSFEKMGSKEGNEQLFQQYHNCK